MHGGDSEAMLVRSGVILKKLFFLEDPVSDIKTIKPRKIKFDIANLERLCGVGRQGVLATM